MFLYTTANTKKIVEKLIEKGNGSVCSCSKYYTAQAGGSEGGSVKGRV